MQLLGLLGRLAVGSIVLGALLLLTPLIFVLRGRDGVVCMWQNA